MEELIGGPLAEALERGRESFNARFAYARSVNRGLEPEHLGWILSRLADPIVRAVAAEYPAVVDTVAGRLFDLALELLGRDCLGPSTTRPVINEAWRDLLPQLARLLGQDPTLAAAVSNAVYNLARQSDSAARKWMAIMGRLAPKCQDGRVFLQAGQAAAWRCGLAHLRAGALETARALPEAILKEIFDSPPAGREEILQTLADPWARLENIGRSQSGRFLRQVARLGGFRGFGGVFLNPPEVATADGFLCAFDQESCFTLHADCYGATVLRFGTDLPPGVHSGPPDFKVEANGRVSKDGVSFVFPHLKNSSSRAADQNTLAVTLPRSHYVYLVALVRE
ncbi:MAG: hypothetical protein AB1641_23385 [Thermodesulfobacteriota bacterium]